MATTAYYKTTIRITSNALDAQIENEVKAALKKLSAVGVEIVDDDDPLVVEAVTDYLRWKHNYEGEAARYEANFRKIADDMALNRGDYDVRQLNCTNH